MVSDSAVTFNLKTSSKDESKWVFSTNNPEFTPANHDALGANDNITVICKIGFYFNISEGSYGWFFTMKEVNFDDLENHPPTTTTTIPKKVKGKGKWLDHGEGVGEWICSDDCEGCAMFKKKKKPPSKYQWKMLPPVKYVPGKMFDIQE